MKITTSTDLQAGTLLIVMELRVRDNADRAGDAAWEGVTNAVRNAQRASRRARRAAADTPPPAAAEEPAREDPPAL